MTEELDREFSKLRALAVDDELTNVTPSSFCKRKKSTKDRPAPTLPPLPTFSDLLRKVQLRPVDKAALTVSQISPLISLISLCLAFILETIDNRRTFEKIQSRFDSTGRRSSE